MLENGNSKLDHPPQENGFASVPDVGPAFSEAPGTDGRKVFVLDTSVILFDGEALRNFAEHDVAIPLTVLEELDQFKKGSSVMNLQAREFIRQLDALSGNNLLREWIPINGRDTGRVRVLAESGPSPDGGNRIDASKLFGNHSNDHRILNTALRLRAELGDRPVILVSKDINLRLKARALNLVAEDYKTIEVTDPQNLHRGHATLEATPGQIDRLFTVGPMDPEEFGIETPCRNHYYILRSPRKSALAVLDGETGLMTPLQKGSAYGVVPRNAEQTFALHAITNPAVKVVTLSGAAGTGKTLIALAGSLERRRDYRQIYLARPIVPLSNRDIGYLPGDIHSKINPYMQPLWDNLSFIKNQFETRQKEYKRLEEMVENEKLQVIPLAYIRGRSFSKVMFIIDEAQNLTPHEVKTIITRAGEDTKIVLTGDIYQIDTPYLDTRSNGLSYLIDRLKGHPLHAHVNLEKGERSELANLASEML